MTETSVPSIPPALTALGFCGGMGAGKTTLVTQLSERWSGAQSISFGDFVRHQAALLGLEPNRENLQNLGQRFYEEHDSASFVDLVLQWKRPQGTIHLFDGVRHVQIWHAIAQRYENAHLIYLDLDVEHQRERLQNRGDIETLLRLGSSRHIVEDERVLLREQASLILSAQNSTKGMIAQIEKFTRIAQDAPLLAAGRNERSGEAAGKSVTALGLSHPSPSGRGWLREAKPGKGKRR